MNRHADTGGKGSSRCHPLATAALAAASASLASLLLAGALLLRLRRGTYDPLDALVLVAMIGLGMLAVCVAPLAVLLGAIALMACRQSRPADRQSGSEGRSAPRGVGMAITAMAVGAVPIVGYATLRLIDLAPP